MTTTPTPLDQTTDPDVLAYWAAKAMPPAFVRTTRARQTGTLVTTGHADALDLDPDEGPWYNVCEVHGTVVSHRTRALAERFASAPLDWCEDCRTAHDWHIITTHAECCVCADATIGAVGIASCTGSHTATYRDGEHVATVIRKDAR